jgi:hypothetical protein
MTKLRQVKQLKNRPVAREKISEILYYTRYGHYVANYRNYRDF